MGDYFKDPLGSKRDKTSFQLPNSAATQRIRTLFWLSYWGLKSNPHKCFLGYECACVHAWWVASAVSDSETLWAVALQTLLPIGFSRQEHWSLLPCPSPGDLPNPGTELASPEATAFQMDSLLLSPRECPLPPNPGLHPQPPLCCVCSHVDPSASASWLLPLTFSPTCVSTFRLLSPSHFQVPPETSALTWWVDLSKAQLHVLLPRCLCSGLLSQTE